MIGHTTKVSGAVGHDGHGDPNLGLCWSGHPLPRHIGRALLACRELVPRGRSVCGLVAARGIEALRGVRLAVAAIRGRGQSRRVEPTTDYPRVPTGLGSCATPR